MIAEQIGRTENAVWLRAKTLGVDKRPEVTPWSAAELAELRRCYGIEPPVDIAVRFGRTPSSAYQQARVLGLLTRKTLIGQSAVADYFDRIDSAEKAYVLGLIAADGNVYKGRVYFGLQARDEGLVAWVRDRLFPDAVIHVARKDGFRSFAMTCHRMAAGLAQWGIVPRKSRILEWPVALPNSMLRPFLLGYFDGDGSAFVIRKHDRFYPGWNVSSGSPEFLMQMKEYIRESTGVVLQKIQRREAASLYQVSKTGRGAYIIDQWLHEDYGLGLARKRIPENIMARYDEPPPPCAAEVLAAKVQAAGRSGITRKEISVEVFRCGKTKIELDAIMAEVLALPGYQVERRRTVGRGSATFLYYERPQM
jgi:hypothetical protein